LRKNYNGRASTSVELLAAVKNIQGKMAYNKKFGSAVQAFRFDEEGCAHIPFCAGTEAFGQIFHRFGFKERATSRNNGTSIYLSSEEECTPLQLKVLKETGDAAAHHGYFGWKQSNFQ
jgi:hypothetical protein